MSAAKRLAACLVVMAACLAALRAVRDRPEPCPPPDSGLLLPPGPEVRTLRLRIDTRIQIADQVLAGELSLVQAAARFRQLNNDSPQHRVFLHQYPGNSDGEKLCRQVIEWADNRVRDWPLTPDEMEATLCPLRRELEALLEQKDEIALPPVD
jgi:hypothetical protein